MVDDLRYRQDLRFVAHQALSGLDARVSAAIDTVNPFVVSSEVSHRTQVQVAHAKAPTAVGVRQTDLPVGNLVVLGVEQGLLAAAESLMANTARAIRMVTPLQHLFGHLVSATRQRYTLARYSLAISALSFCSSCIFLRRRSSSSSSFMGAIRGGPVRQTWLATCHRWRCLCPASDKSRVIGLLTSNCVSAAIIWPSIYLDLFTQQSFVENPTSMAFGLAGALPYTTMQPLQIIID